MKVAIIEPNLVDYTGHYYFFATELKKGFEKLGDEVSIFLPKNSSPEIGGKRVLPRKKKTSKSKFFRYLEFPLEAGKYFFSLKKYQKEYDVFIFPSADNPPHIIFGASFLRKTTPLIFYFHSPDHFFYPLGKSVRQFFIFSKWSKKKVVCLTPNSWGNDILNKLQCENVQFLGEAPYAANFPSELKAGSTVERYFLGYLGDARNDKNFKKLIEIIENSKDDLGFIVQCHQPAMGGYEPDIKEAVEYLKILKGKNIFLFYNTLSKKEYWELLAQSSIVWCLYNPQSYRNRVSGIFFEAWSLGKPVITTAGTWMAKQVEKYGGGIVVQNMEVPIILEAINKIKEDYNKFSSQALAAGKYLYSQNNGYALARFIKNLAHY